MFRAYYFPTSKYESSKYVYDSSMLIIEKISNDDDDDDDDDDDNDDEDDNNDEQEQKQEREVWRCWRSRIGGVAVVAGAEGA